MGIRGSELAERHLKTDEDLYNHIEDFHGIPVIRKGETERQAIDRCTKKGIVADRNKCQCSECEEMRKNENNRYEKVEDKSFEAKSHLSSKDDNLLGSGD